MRGRVLVLALALGLAAAFLTRGAGPLAPVPSAPGHAPQLATEATPPPMSFERLDRDPFRYLSDSEPASSGMKAPPLPAPEPQQEATPAPLRLVGLIRQGGQLRAALSIHDVAVTAATGEVIEGFEVLSVDEDAGVRLRDASGAEVSLRPE